MMGSQCGQTDMPGSRGCCHKYFAGPLHDALTVKAIFIQEILGAPAILAPSQSEWVALLGRGFIEQSEYPPPGSPPASISVLRI